jgi:hypothetical protein
MLHSIPHALKCIITHAALPASLLCCIIHIATLLCIVVQSRLHTLHHVCILSVHTFSLAYIIVHFSGVLLTCSSPPEWIWMVSQLHASAFSPVLMVGIHSAHTYIPVHPDTCILHCIIVHADACSHSGACRDATCIVLHWLYAAFCCILCSQLHSKHSNTFPPPPPPCSKCSKMHASWNLRRSVDMCTSYHASECRRIGTLWCTGMQKNCRNFRMHTNAH